MKATDCPPLLADFIKNKRRVNFLDLIIIKSSFTLLNMLLQCRQVYKENKFRFKFHLILFHPFTLVVSTASIGSGRFRSGDASAIILTSVTLTAEPDPRGSSDPRARRILERLSLRKTPPQPRISL